MDKFYNLKDKIEQDVIPAKLADYPKNWQCQYCSFKDVCKAVNGGEMRWQDFKDKIESQSA
jgi:hypothetical protein